MYTAGARALAGMLEKMGLLSKDNNEQINMAWVYCYISDSSSQRANSIN